MEAGGRATTLVTLLRQLFRQFDPNATGHLGTTELQELFVHVMGESTRQTARSDAMIVIRNVDTDANGT